MDSSIQKSKSTTAFQKSLPEKISQTSQHIDSSTRVVEAYSSKSKSTGKKPKLHSSIPKKQARIAKENEEEETFQASLSQNVLVDNNIVDRLPAYLEALPGGHLPAKQSFRDDPDGAIFIKIVRHFLNIILYM